MNEEKINLAQSDQLKEDKQSDAMFMNSPIVKRTSLKMQKIFLDMADKHSEEEDVDFFLEKGEDVMGRFGSGMISYFSLLKISAFFLVMAVAAFLPLMLQYSSWTHAENEVTENPAFKYSLGNFGDSEQLCHRVKLVG